MPGSIRILSVEDSHDDYELLLYHLRREGWQPVGRRVETEEQMLSALEEDWDVILSDYALPGFSASAALRLRRERAPSTPFLIVSGQIDEETAVRAMREGAHDYILKDRLGRLGPALERELTEAGERRARRQAEVALERSEARFRAFVENTSEGIGRIEVAPPLPGEGSREERVRRVRLDASIVEVNAALAETLGWADSREGIGRRPPLLERLSEEELSHLIEGPMRLDRRESRETVGGEIRDFLDTLHAEPGEAISTIWWSRTEVTDLRRIEEATRRQQDELARADRMISLGTLVSGVAHEINNPNQFVMLNLPILRQAWRDLATWVEESSVEGARPRLARMEWDEAKSELGELIEECLQGTHRIRAIVEDLRAYARDDAEHLGRGSFDPNEAVRASLRLLANTIKKSTRRLTVQLDDDLPQLEGSLRRIEQVVINVLLNSCQSLETAEAAIEVSTGLGEDGTTVVIAVRDEGRGIAHEDLARITDPFFTRKRDEGGSGLGLAVSARIVEEHGGRLTFESTPGQGTTVRLVLPCPPPDAERPGS